MDFFWEGKRIGSFKDGVFRKRVKKSKHLFKKFDAWGIQYSALKQLHGHHCEEIRILDTDENKVYSVPFSKMFGSSQVENFGDGLQAFLPRSEWTIEDYQVD